MQKRSHKLLASMLLESRSGFAARRFELAFLLGSFQPDCNPFTYLRGFFRTHSFGGHNYINSKPYIHAQIRKLQRKTRWNIRQYYTLGKVSHYLADAFTFPHNEHFHQSLPAHRQYETALRLHLADLSAQWRLHRAEVQRDLIAAIEQLHRQYLSKHTDIFRDARYIMSAAELLMAGCQPPAGR